MEARETCGSVGAVPSGAERQPQRLNTKSELEAAPIPATAANPVAQPKKRGPKPGALPRRTVMAKAPAATLRQMVRAYLDDLQVRNYKPKTINGYAKNLAMFVTWAETQGATTLADLNTDLAKRYIRYLQEKPKYAERGYATVSAERV